MRLTQLFGMSMSLSFVLLAACGDDGGKKVTPIDSSVQIDAPAGDAPRTCTIPATIGGLSIGSQAAPASPPQGSDWIEKDMMTNEIDLTIGGRLPAPNDSVVLLIVYPRPANGFATGTVPFATDPTADGPFAEVALLNGQSISQILFSSSGTINLTAVGQTAGANINGTVSATNFKEIDDQGNVVPGGCTSSLMGLQFFLKQMGTVTFAPTQHPGGKPAPWQTQLQDFNKHLGLETAQTFTLVQ